MKKPMLLSNDEYDLDNLNYSNMYKSTKRDGIRAEVTNQGIKNRSLKILRNTKIQNWFKDVYENLPDGIILDAEIYCDGIPCREMAGVCNSLDKDVPVGTKLYIFGIFDKELTFKERYQKIATICAEYCEKSDKYEIVEQTKCESAEDATYFFNYCLDNGFEGAVLMNGNSKYKEGRVTINQHIGFKLKPHRFDDLKIIGVNERMENTNESQINELGHSFKRNTVDAKASTGIAATFDCLMADGITETKVTITGDEAFRREIWENKEKYIGCYAVIKSMDYGAKDKLRHPRLVDIKMQVEK